MIKDSISTPLGLSQVAAALQLQTDGFNELASAKPRSPFAIALDVVREPMFVLLLACAVVYLFLGDREEALMLMSAVVVVMGITFYQERKTERTLEALRDLSSPRALVVRDGEEMRIPGREVVLGDLVILAEGDRIPADGVLLSGLNVAADESLLTGESMAVRKSPRGESTAMQRPGGEDTPFVYAGTLVVQGRGTALVKATGTHTEMGNIGMSLQAVEPEVSLLQRSTKRFVRAFASIGAVLCLIVVAVYGLTRGSWLNGLLAGITMSISMIPEEFPVVLTIFLALGAWRLAQKNVLTRRVPAIETLGAATVLCVDKTGTLTQNQMSVSKLSRNGVTFDVSTEDLPETFAELVRCGILASQPDPFDPMEKAIYRLRPQTLSSAVASQKDWLLVRQYALSPHLLAMSHVWKAPDHPYYTVTAKGAPEAIAILCRFDESRKEALNLEIKALAQQGLRVLGVAEQRYESETLPETQDKFAFTFLGLIGLADPVRPMVPDAVKECARMGIRVIMITGDYPDTARSIARQIGLRSPEEVITGSELSQMDAETMAQRIRSVDIFARVMPEQKLFLVNALKADGEVVAMTGDGVNDAPALKAAHIGIAMGKRGTDVAREAAALVLLDDDFASIVQAIRLGRRIYRNIKDAMAYIIAIHVPIAGLSLLPVLFGWPLILLPVHIVFLELVIDPACSVVFEAEPEDPEAVYSPPRDPKEPLFTWHALGLSLLQGASVLIIALTIFCIALYRGQGEAEARALTYTTLIIANLGLILTNLSWSRTIIQTLTSPNKALWWVLVSVTAAVSLILYSPFLRKLFRFSFLHPIDLALCVGAGATSILWFEGFKVVRSRQKLKKRVVPTIAPS